MSSVVPLLSFPPLHTVHAFRQIRGETHTNLVCAGTNAHTRSHTNAHSQSQATQCLVQNGLIAGLITKETRH